MEVQGFTVSTGTVDVLETGIFMEVARKLHDSHLRVNISTISKIFKICNFALDQCHLLLFLAIIAVQVVDVNN